MMKELLKRFGAYCLITVLIFFTAKCKYPTTSVFSHTALIPFPRFTQGLCNAQLFEEGGVVGG